MAVDLNMKDYNKRVKRIDKRHRKLSGGYTTSVNHDGLIVAKARRHGPRFPWKGIALSFVAFFVFKGFLLAQLGEATYNDRVEALKSGTVVEKVGAYVMSADSVSVLVSEKIATVLR